ncbi:unnamed protein product [Adineta steineri]|uniref:Phytanoyl-CoA dioxygenase n=1 Tax=Adineta steineri TaxID=433720 RepID=A0A814U190_9BILA|nr:unnamed protein product [Adineta steineri]CAF1167494.1 unnamed protein product [Adineta steineri]CAF4058571.1 unnamed protein product [Adineta steineri]CAF4079540.1 unnamed protein product [Adineta steineri]
MATEDKRALDRAWIIERADEVRRTGATLIKSVIPVEKIDELNRVFQPLLKETERAENGAGNRGPSRYYVTPPFRAPWTDISIIDNDIIMAIVSELVGADGVFCQLATDTPCLGSEYQDLHRDTQSLFPEWEQETPPYQLAVNFPLVDCHSENGPLEMAPSTHLLAKDEALRRIQSGEICLEQVLMKRGDILIRDVRHIHRGTPNKTDEPRPMVVLGYSRRWLFRPEVQIRVAQEILEQVPLRTRKWLRFNPVFNTIEEAEKKEELYRSFAY